MSEKKKEQIKVTIKEKTYNNLKDGWVQFSSKKRKNIKLRKWINDKAKNLAKFCGGLTSYHKTQLIVEFNDGGVKQVESYYYGILERQNEKNNARNKS